MDFRPTLTLKTVPGVIDKTVNIRRYQTYAPCKLDAATGVMQQPENSFYGDKLCDPGFTAFDILQKRTLGEIIETRKDLTAEVLACPPVECETLESCESHKYSKKGLTGCIDTSIEGPTRILFTVRDDSSQVTKVYRDVVIIAPCPTGYDYCPGVGDNPCQTSEVCENAATLSAAAAVTDEGSDYAARDHQASSRGANHARVRHPVPVVGQHAVQALHERGESRRRGGVVHRRRGEPDAVRVRDDRL